MSTCLGSTILAQGKDNLKEKNTTDTISRFKSPPSVYWITLGYGACVTIDDEAPVSFCTILNAQYNHHVFSARVVYGSGQQTNKLPHEEVFDAGILYGYGKYDSLWFVNASIGLAYTFVTKRIYLAPGNAQTLPFDVYRAERTKSIGLPWQLQAFSKFSASADFGLGIIFCGDINKLRSFLTVYLSLVGIL